MGDPDAGRPHAYSATTDFERRSHAEMLKMVEDGNAVEVSRLGKKLLDAETTLNEIGGTLKTDMTRLDWDSEAGDAFRAWGHTIAKATESLADYSGTAGRFMEHAGTVLGEVQKAMPKVPNEAKKIADAHTLNPLLDTESVAGPRPGEGTVLAAGPTAKEIADARTEVDDARQQAAAQMTKLAQAYNMSTDILKSSEPPVFPPTPPEAMPPPPDAIYESDRFTPPPDTGGRSSFSPSDTSQHNSPLSSADPASPGGRQILGQSSGSHPVTPIAETRLDSVVPAPSRPDSTGAGPGLRTPGTDAPVKSGTAPGAFVPPGGALPGRPVGATGIPGGSAGVAAPRVPGVAAGTPGGVVRRVAGEGIQGGRPVPGGGPVNQIPRGTVVGADRAATSARPPVGGGYGGGVGGANPQAIAGGRRLASEPGGVVGAPRRAAGSAGTPFTPGGSGLAARRDDGSPGGHGVTGGATGAPRPGVPGAGDDGRSRREDRPDYLVEDEETWVSGRRPVQPPVID